MRSEEAVKKLPVVDIDFDEEGHIYTLRGMRMPSVTQIMRPMSLMLYSDVSDSALYGAADRGTRAHAQVEAIVKYGVEEWDEDTEGYIRAFQAFQAAFHKEWLGSEYRTYHKVMRYAGTIDLIADAGAEGAVDVIDIKTTAQFHRKMLETQLGAYAEALKSWGVKVHGVYGLQLLKDGNYRFERLEEDYRTFLHCMGVVNAMAIEGGTR